MAMIKTNFLLLILFKFLVENYEPVMGFCEKIFDNFITNFPAM